MARTAISGAVVVVLAAGLVVSGSAIGITTIWPVLLAIAVGLAARPLTIGRVVAYVAGAIISWVMLAVRAGYLPDVVASEAVVLVVGVVLLTILAVLTADRVPLWAGLAGYAAFAGLYEPMFAEVPTAFLTESPAALVTVLLAAGAGILIAEVADLATGGRRGTAERVELVDGGVA